MAIQPSHAAQLLARVVETVSLEEIKRSRS